MHFRALIDKPYISGSSTSCMDLHLIPVVKKDVHILRVKTPEHRRVVLSLASKGKEIVPSEATCQLITLCDGTHTLKEIVSHFVEISGEDFSSIKLQVEKALVGLAENEVIEFFEVPTPRKIPPEVELIHPLGQLYMEITNACNLNCIHCYNDSEHKGKDELTLEEIYHVIDEAKNLGVLRITLSGGEPLVHPHFFEIAEYIRNHFLELELFTNGTLVTKEVAEKLKDLALLRVSVSLDSLNPEIHDYFRGRKGSWKKTMEGIRNLEEEDIKIKPAIALSKLNLEEVIDLRKFLLERGFNDYQLMPVFATRRNTPLDIGITPEEYQKAIEDVFMLEKDREIESKSMARSKSSGEKTINCGIGTYSLVIKSDGGVIPCSAFGDEALLGNVKDQSLKEIWNNSSVLNRLRDLDARNHPVCSACNFLEHCRGGCMANVSLATGTLNVHDPYTCAYAKASRIAERK